MQRFSARVTHSRVIRACWAGSGMEKSLSRQDANVFPAGSPAALRRIFRDQLDHDQAQPPRRRRPGQPGRHPRRVPELAAVTAAVRAFAAIMNERRGRKLPEQWMTAAIATGEPALRSFVVGLRADQSAITSGFSLPWSSGAVEGHVNRIKMFKRQMYGRASPDLLRRRVLLAD
jgi:Transposase